ncbi:PRC-barrel domain-containing protein [Loktanella atrilutea]|uniref:PRC-barrel domain-containing protein n=1 Tax=Loktanella atrilutea TaxID=366533 RepID=A0A1M4W6J9_LOKAT|nr:PRC-barrel domain-containing protein [Loktanella atrilutea]SHE76775.1 PRC-barrel domain-containing protein [Loktanella atrilutea]
MKTILASTAIALVMASAATAQTSAATDGTSQDSMSVQSTGTDTGTAAGAATDGTSTDSMSVDSTGAATAPTDTGMTAAETPATDGTSNDSMSVAAPTITMDGYSDVAVAEVTVDQLTGLTVYDTEGATVGAVSEPVTGDDGSVSDVIVDVGGFLGLGAKPVAIPLESLQVLANADGSDMRAYVGMTKDQLTEMPTYEAN